MARARHVRHLLLACALLPACSASHRVDPLAEDRRVFDAVARELCAREVSCAPWHEAGRFRPAYDCDPEHWETVRAGIVDGSYIIDRDAAARCLEGLRALGECVVRDGWTVPPPGPDEDELLDTCDQVAVRADPRPNCDGELCAVGDGCAVDSECRDHCAHWGDVGEPCGSGALCLLHLACVDGACAARCDPAACREAGFDGCIDNACAHYGGVGEPCDPGGRCVRGAVCDYTPRVCVSGLPAGAPCVPGVDLCDESTCNPSTGRCSTSGACVDPECGPGEVCSSDGIRLICVPTEGSTCWFLSFDYLRRVEGCPEGFECRFGGEGLGACHAVVPLDGACSEPRDCSVGGACADGRCVAPALPEESCDAAHPCATGFDCDAGICVLRPESTPGHPCDEGHCDAGQCVDGMCEYLPEGAACSGSWECPRCIDGVCQPFTELERGESCAGWPADAYAMCGGGLYCSGGVEDGSRFCCS